MTLLATLLWPVLAASLLLGTGIGWLTGLPRTGPARWSAAALVLAVCLSGGLALSGLVPGRAGSWLENGALALGAYLAGAVLASGLSAALSRRVGARS